MQIAELWRYPVKSLQGERLESAEFGPLGLLGDRRYAIFDRATGFGLTARRAPELLYAAARLSAGGGVEITLPDGRTATDDDALSEWLGRPVELRSSETTGDRRYENPDDIETEAPESWGLFHGAAGAFHDSSVVTLVSTATLRGADPRRFRANILLDGDGEDDLVGSTVLAGTALLHVTQPVIRCVMVTRPQPGGIGHDRDVLRRIHRDRGGMLSVAAVVARPGVARVGDDVASAEGRGGGRHLPEDASGPRQDDA